MGNVRQWQCASNAMNSGSTLCGLRGGRRWLGEGRNELGVMMSEEGQLLGKNLLFVWTGGNLIGHENATERCQWLGLLHMGCLTQHCMSIESTVWAEILNLRTHNLRDNQEGTFHPSLPFSPSAYSCVVKRIIRLI